MSHGHFLVISLLKYQVINWLDFRNSVLLSFQSKAIYRGHVILRDFRISFADTRCYHGINFRMSSHSDYFYTTAVSEHSMQIIIVECVYCYFRYRSTFQIQTKRQTETSDKIHNLCIVEQRHFTKHPYWCIFTQ